jgi:hypothetical protein
MEDVQWRRWLGKKDGQNVFNFLVSVSKNEGTMPKGDKFEHLETEWEMRRRKKWGR